MRVVVNGLLTYYRRVGTGREVLVLHGWGDSSKGLEGLQAKLSRQFDVVTPDLPGFGETQAPPSAWGLADYAEFTKDFLTKLGVKNLYAIIGHSNGGAIAIRGIGTSTLSAEKLVLLASSGMRSTYKGRRKTLRLVTKAGKAVTKPLPKSAKRKLRRQVYRTIGSDMLVAEHLQETFKKVVTDDVQADATKISSPTLLIYGENDSATPVEFGRKFHELIPDSTLEILPGAGHFALYDWQDEVVKSIQDFLN